MYLGAECAYCAGGLMASIGSAGDPEPLTTGSGSSMFSTLEWELPAGVNKTLIEWLVENYFKSDT